VGGGIALAAGVVLVVTARSPAATVTMGNPERVPHTPPVTSASVAFGPRGVVVRGAF